MSKSNHSSDYNILKNSLLFNNAMGGLWTDNADETFVVMGPDSWFWHGGKAIVREKHLESYLGVQKILFPPGAKDKHINGKAGEIAIARFPLWHRCKGWRTLGNGKKEPCGAMVKLAPDSKLPLCTHSNCSGSESKQKSKKKWVRSTFAPVRFMTACTEGHLNEFPFHWWVHKDEHHDECELRYITIKKAGLQGILIQCETCSSQNHKVQRSMSGALSAESFNGKYRCQGGRPWLKTNCSCTGDESSSLVGVQKSSSNLLFPIVRNAIFCPDKQMVPDWLNRMLQDPLEHPTKLESLKNALEMMPGLTISKALEFVFSKNPRIPEILKYSSAIEQMLRKDLPEGDTFQKNGYKGILQREFQRFLEYPEENKSDDFSVKRPSLEDFDPLVQQVVDSVVLLEKLRDTRAYVGFSRVLPWGEEEQGNINALIHKCYGSTREVYGDVVRGEGLFLKFREDKIDDWLQRPEVHARLDLLDKKKLAELTVLLGIEEFWEAQAFMLLHSFSHSLMGALSGQAGYNLASLKERVYVGSDGVGGRMFGLLIYTNSGDSEGSLGGLVRMGRPGRLGNLFRGAVDSSKWCSSDPLCRRSIPKGSGGGVLSACHHCIMLPETSCQCRNDFLDREMIISLDNANLGFFNP